MSDIARRALDTAAQLGAGYADVRIVRRYLRRADVKSGRVEGVQLGETEGFGVRVLVDGAWGFASSGHMRGPEADRVADQAVRIARAAARFQRAPVQLSDRAPANGRHATPFEEDPFAVPVDETIDLLLDARRRYARGPQLDYFDHPDIIGWTRHGDVEHPEALAVLITDGPGGTKWMDTGRAGIEFRDLTGGFAEPVHAVFIRAPWIRKVGADVEVLASVEDPASGASRPVFVRQDRILATSFHPELTDDTRIHEMLMEVS